MPDLPVRAPLLAPALLALVVGCTSAPLAEPIDSGQSDAPASASVQPSSAGSPSPTSSPTPAREAVHVTYDGEWTLTAYANDADYDEPEFRVGDTRPGTVEIECNGTAIDYCNVTLTSDGEPFSVTSAEVIGDGELSMVLEDELANCTDGQVSRMIIEIVHGDGSAEATYERSTQPRTCDDGSGTLYATDDTWTFEGTGGD